MKTPIPKFSSVTQVNFKEDEYKSTPIESPRTRLLENYSHLGEELINKVINQIQDGGLSIASKVIDLYAITKVLHFLSNETSPESEKIRIKLCSGKFNDINADDAQNFERLLEKHLHKASGKNILKASRDVLHANKALQIMFDAKVWPYTLRIPNVRVPFGYEKSNPSLLESLIQTINKGEKVDLSESIKNAKIKAALDFLGIEHSFNITNQISAILNGEKECIKRIRNELSIQIEEHYRVHVKANELINKVDDSMLIEIEKWLNFYEQSHEFGPLAKKFALARGLFWGVPNGINNYLAAIKLFYFNGEKSIIHKFSNEKIKNLGFYLRNIRSIYLVEEFKEHFTNTKMLYNLLNDFFCPSSDLVVKTALLLMVETGMNRSPSLALQKNMIKPDDDPGWLSIASWKDRANGSLIYENIYLSKPHEKISSGTAILKLIEFHNWANYGIKLSPEFENAIFFGFKGFISESKPAHHRISRDYVKPIFDAIISESFGASIKLAPSSIRVSLLTIERASSGNLRTASLKAAHKSIDTTNSHYSGRNGYLFKFENIENIRGFQGGVEAIALDNLHSKITSDRQDISELIHRTGLGTLCLRNTHKPEEATCTNFNVCPGCPSLMISTAPNDLADLLEWAQYLEGQKDYILINKGDAWQSKWIFWTQLVDEILESGPRSTWAKNLSEAKEILKTRVPPNYPVLW